jgi:hypothetical protein
MKQGVAERDYVTVHTDTKIERKTRRRDGTGLHEFDVVAVVSEPEDKTYRVSALKRRRLDDLNPVPFGYASSDKLLIALVFFMCGRVGAATYGGGTVSSHFSLIFSDLEVVGSELSTSPDSYISRRMPDTAHINTYLPGSI